MRESSFFFMVFLLLFSLLSYSRSVNGADNASEVPVQPKLHPSEVNALRQIAKKLGKKDWDFSVDPCTGGGNFTVPDRPKGFESGVYCNCSFSNHTSCRINSISIKAENLSGVLPPEFGQLVYLEQLDLSRNVLTGGVPNEWTSMQLQGLSLLANKLSGLFPMALTKITTLTNLSIEGNQFAGPIPPEIGNLVQMEKLVLSANKFTGNLPASLGQLTNLTDLRISSNNFSGKIPDFLSKLKNLEKLQIQGCSLGGPFPPGISKLTDLADLRISDLIGNGSAFPDLSAMKSMKTLILRNCSIYGNIPPNIGEMKKLKILDLSFNKLTGEIPKSFENFEKVDFIYLTGNMLSGSIPQWILIRNKNADVSNNNFTVVSPSLTQCPQGSINTVESYSPILNNKQNINSCLKKNFPCTSTGKHQAELHINCGGKEVIVNKTKFEEDSEPKGASMFYTSPTNWAFSSTGNFLDNNIDSDNYIANNVTKLNMPNSELYTKARLSPLSLKYYGLCMYNGSYTVKLYFAEIVFTNDNTFTSLGERIFNVFIQGDMVLEKFNIEKAAGGAGKEIIKTFIINVINNTLEINLYWAGKGTTGIPDRGFYGPLISAISVIPNFVPPEEPSQKIPRWVIILVPVMAFLVITLCACICWRRCRKNDMYKDLRALDLQVGSFTLRQIKSATKNFDPANKIGEGGFGSVYKGLLSDGTIIAVKQLSSKSKQGNKEFVNEIGMISSLQHENLVKLYGCCSEGNQLCLIYEYMEHNCLARALFGSDERWRVKLDWETRRNICLGIARGLAYLHEDSTIRIVHRDIKASNILLDKDLTAKISDFGLARLNEDDRTHISTRIAGTIGYMAPEYAMRGYLTDKADVYSFGVVALETISGKSNTNYRPKEECVYLLDWACVLQERGTLLDLVDPNLGEDYSKEEALLMLNISLLCTNASPTLRPTMTKVVNLLEGRTPLQALLSDVSRSAMSANRSRPRSFWEINPSEGQSMTLHVSHMDSSESLTETEPLVYE